MKRRDFIRSSAAVAAFHNFPYHLYAGTKKQASDRIKLGPMRSNSAASRWGPELMVPEAVRTRPKS